MLEDASEYGFENVISWCADGKSFKIHDRDQFAERLLPKYFNMKAQKSFYRQCNYYQFVRISGGRNHQNAGKAKKQKLLSP